jgi:hypothetical protein
LPAVLEKTKAKRKPADFFVRRKVD